eukprot:7147647-Alexandrium_andersonii.AAC.1
MRRVAPHRRDGSAATASMLMPWSLAMPGPKRSKRGWSAFAVSRNTRRDAWRAGQNFPPP